MCSAGAGDRVIAFTAPMAAATNLPPAPGSLVPLQLKMDNTAMASMWGRLMRPISAHFRGKRLATLKELFPDIASYSILDVGGSFHFWDVAGPILGTPDVTILNIAESGQSGAPSSTSANLRIQLYDGQHIPFEDRRFDLVICNSVIEHVPPARRAQLAGELARVGKRLYVQTPAKEFPVEVHFIMPGLHWVPRGIGRRLAFVTPYAAIVREKTTILEYFDEVQLLSKSAFTKLFGTEGYVPERFAGLTKSHQIVRSLVDR